MATSQPNLTTGQAAWNAAGQAGLGAVAGSIPDTSKTTSTGSSSNVSTGSVSQNASSQLQNYLKTIANLFGTTSGTTSGTQTGTGTTTTTPNLSPQMQAYINSLIGSASTLTSPTLTGYSAQQTQNINTNADLQKQAVQNIMASRGLSVSPVAATAQSGVEQNRINQITQMQQQIPVLQNQLQLQNMAQAAQIANMMPTLAGSTSTTQQQAAQQQANQQQTTQQQTGESTQDQFTQSWQNLYNFLQNFGNTYNTQNTTSGGGLGGAISGGAQGLAAALPFIIAAMSDKRLKSDIRSLSQDKAISKIRELNGRTWKWKGGDRSDSGFVAQEVEKILPDIIEDVNIGGKDLKAINYSAMIPYLVGAIQNLDARVGE